MHMIANTLNFLENNVFSMRFSDQKIIRSLRNDFDLRKYLSFFKSELWDSRFTRVPTDILFRRFDIFSIEKHCSMHYNNILNNKNSTTKSVGLLWCRFLQSWYLYLLCEILLVIKFIFKLHHHDNSSEHVLIKKHSAHII